MIRKAAQKFAIIGATGISALLLLDSALASTEVQTPCPELEKHSEASLHAILDNTDVTSPVIRTIDSAETNSPAPVADTVTKTAVEEHEGAGDADEAGIRNADMPDMSTRLPGVSSSDLPRFRRHMYRTDI